ncbi:MAG: protein kinase domain-containing protein [Bryobacteraceae bacterium]
MSLVEMALSRSPDERERYLRTACLNRPDIFEEAWSYVQQEQRMEGFLSEPFLPPPREERFLQPGDLLHERFRIVRKVAQGGMGVVYEAQDEKLGRRIAIKCAKADFHERLPPEVRNASEISHPNVCRIFEIHTSSMDGEEFDFLTMEFVDGPTLSERMRSGAIGMKEARIIGRQLCEGLAEAHRNEVIHADLKSGNVILGKAAGGEVRAVIMDFGLASGSAAARANADPDSIAGTPDYMAPELWNRGKPSVASDLYALGVMLYELAAGRKPFPANASREDRLERKPPPVKHPWNAILQRCLDPDPALRPADAGEVLKVVSPSASLRLWLAAAAVLTLLAILFSGWMYWQANAPEETVRLAVLPFESREDARPLATRLSSDALAELARLERSRRTEVKVIAAGGAGVNDAARARQQLKATHVIRANVATENGKIVIQVWLIDTNSMANAKEWKAAYDPAEIRYIPVAIAGTVTGAFHLPSVKRFDGVNAQARADYQAGLAYLRKDSTIDTALPLLERAAAADPDSAMTHAALAEGYYWKNRIAVDKRWLERAAVSVREAERRNPDLAPVHSVAGLLMTARGWHEQAQLEYLRAIELEPGNGDTFRRIGLVYDELKEHDKALASYRRAIELAPDYHRNHQAIGAYWIDRAKYQEAIQHLRRTVELAAGEPEAYFALSSAYGHAGQLTDAEAVLRKALALGETARVLNALGTALMYQGRDREAIPYFTLALKQQPERYLLWMNMGTAYRRLNLAADSARANRRALRLLDSELQNNPKGGYVRSCVAYVCARLGQRDRSESEIAQALQLSPENNETRRMAVKTYEALELREETLRILSASPPEVLADMSRYPDLADLHRDSRFRTMLGSSSHK